MTVKMNAAALDDAMLAATSLASRIESARQSALSAVPPGGPSLPSLGAHGIVGTAPEWLRGEAEDPLGVVRDLAILLGSQDGSSITWDGSTTGDIAALKTELGRRISRELADVHDIRSPEDLARAQAATDLLLKYVDDPDITATVALELGPEGVARVIGDAAAMTGQFSNYPSTYDVYEDSSYGEEYEKVRHFQDDLANALSGALATASTAHRLSADYGRRLVESSGPLPTAVIFDYGHRKGHVFGKDFLTGAGDALLEWENGGEGMFWQAMADPYQTFGTADQKALQDPVVKWLEALSDNTAASQEVLLDPDKASYLLERHSYGEETRGDAAGMVLQTATVDQALSHGTYGKNAATISAWAIEHYGGKATAQLGVNEELGAIVATYIRDVDRIAYNVRSAEGSGIYEPGAVPAGTLFDDAGFPPYGIRLNRESLKGLLDDIGDNDTAISLIGSATSRLNEVRMNVAIDEVAALTGESDGSMGSRDLVFAAARSNAGLQGFLYDNLLEGGISDARKDEEQRRRLAKLLLVPTDLVKVPGGPLGSYVVGEVKSQLTDAYVGNGASDAVSSANDVFDDIQAHTRIQALHTLVTSDAGLPIGGLADAWPQDAHGHPKSIAELTNEEETAIINLVNTGGEGYASDAFSGALAGTDVFLEQYGGS